MKQVSARNVFSPLESQPEKYDRISFPAPAERPVCSPRISPGSTRLGASCQLKKDMQYKSATQRKLHRSDGASIIN